MPLDDLHQLYLQSCMSRRSFSDKTSEVIYKKCIVASGLDERECPSLADLLDEINSAIEPFGFQIKRFQDEHSGKAWQAFVNTKSDELAKVATDYGPQEISYFRTLIKLIMKSGRRYCITSMEAKRAGSRSSVTPTLSPTQAEAVLSTFVARGWFVIVSAKHRNERMEMIQLSARARMELEHYLMEEYPKQTDKDFNCKICDEMVMKGRQCKTENCKMRMHDHCARAYANRNGARTTCPVCRQRFMPDEAIAIGPDSASTVKDWSSDEESEVEEEEEAQAPSRDTRKRKKAPVESSRRDPLEEDSDEEKDQLADDDEENDEMQED